MPKHIQDLIDLAEMYFKHGAVATAADRLGMAASEMQKIADERADLINQTIDN